MAIDEFYNEKFFHVHLRLMKWHIEDKNFYCFSHVDYSRKGKASFIVSPKTEYGCRFDEEDSVLD